MKYNRIVLSALVFLCSSLIASCDKYDYWDEIEDGSSYERIDVTTIRKRADLLAEVPWTAINIIPRNSGNYVAGQSVNGIPYSSARELDKFVGNDVSLYTFLTAANNPRSVLYTENIGRPPYHSTNCSSYYGTVCSAAICYALGLGMPFSTAEVKSLPFFKKVKTSSPQNLRVTDILWKRGHDIMIYDLHRDASNDSIIGITVFEAIGNGTRKVKYSMANFNKFCGLDKYDVYRFIPPSSTSTPNFIERSSESLSSLEHLIYNNDICTSHGDRAVFREGDSVTINILNSTCSVLRILKNGSFYKDIEIESIDVILADLPYGQYSVKAISSKGNYTTESTEFEIVDANVSILDKGSCIDVAFNSTMASPSYVSVCTIGGDRLVTTKLSDADISKGKIEIKKPSTSKECYCKVYFETEWGRVTNKPIQIQSILSSGDNNDEIAD